MAISLTEFRTMMKSSSMTPGNQAMADAAKMATPPGGIPLPNMPKPEEQQTTDQVQQNAVQDAMKYRAELERKDKELAAARRQIQQAENTAQHARNLAEVQKREDEAMLKIKEQEAKADARIRQNEAASLQRMQQNQAPQIDFKSKEEAHQARLERDSALEKAKRALEMSAERDALTQEKAKATVDIAEQDAKSRVNLADQNAQAYISNTEKMRRAAENEEFVNKKHNAELENIARGGLVQKAAAQQMPSAGVPKTKPQQPMLQPKPATQPVTPPAQATAAPKTQAPTAQQIPSSATEQYKKNQQYIKEQQDRTKFLQEQGKQTAQVANASDQSLYGRGVAIATAKNQLHRLEREGKHNEAKALKQSIAGLQTDFDTYKKSLEYAAKGGDREAKNQLARYGDAAYRHGTNSDMLDAKAEHGFFTRMLRKLQGKKNLSDFAGQSELERIATQDEREQISNEVGGWRWLDPSKLYGDAVNLVSGGVVKSIEDDAQSRDMARRRGVEREWWGSGSGRAADVADYNEALQTRGLKSSIMGNAARIGAEGAMAAATFVPIGGAGTLAARGLYTAGKTALRQGAKEGLKAGWSIAKPGLTSGKALAATGLGVAGIGGGLLAGRSQTPVAEYVAPSGMYYKDGKQYGMNWQGVQGVPAMYNYQPYASSQYQPGLNWNMYDPNYRGNDLWKYASTGTTSAYGYTRVKPVSTPVLPPPSMDPNLNRQKAKSSVPQRDPLQSSDRFGTNAIDYQAPSASLPGIFGTAMEVAAPMLKENFDIDIYRTAAPKMNAHQRFDPNSAAVRTSSYMNDENPVLRSVQSNWLNYYGYPLH